MKTEPLTENDFVIEKAKASWFAKFVLITLMLISWAIPIVATIFALRNDINMSFGIIFSYLLFGGIGIYLFRAFLWNTYGQEIFKLNNDEILYTPDYRLFKGSLQKIRTDGLTAELIDYDESDSDSIYGRIRLTNGQDEIKTVLKSRKTDLKIIIDNIKTQCNQGE